jgi:threonine dehydrogenase-like Zn-dependent dehydrogenase
MVVGITEQETSIRPMDLVFHEIEMKGSMMFSSDEFKLALELLAQGKIKTDLFISDIIPLDSIEEQGFKRLLSSPDSIKILVKPNFKGVN